MANTRGILPGLALAAALGVSPAHAAYDPVFDDGFDCRQWFIDADGDGFGAAGTGVLTCDPPPGRAPRADDCDDADPLANPRAPDRPDPAYRDANCDGFDGDAARAVHVALTGIDNGTCGDRLAACRTIAFALGRRSAARPDVYVQQGAYAGPVLVTAPSFAGPSGIYGGFLADWSRAPGATTEILGAASPAIAQNALGMSIQGGTTLLGDLRIAAPAASGTHANGGGRGSFALIVLGASFEGFGLRLEAGAGAAGLVGSGGGAAPAAAASGGPGVDGVNVACSTLAGGLGGNGAANACPGGRATGGGIGGRGGAADSDCGGFPPDIAALPGQAGASAAFVQGVAGNGGAGGTGASSCSTPVSGSAGALGASGAPGAGGNGGVVAAGAPRWWQANGGSDGGTGENGGGGGAGGGAGGCDAGVNSRGAGGGGGGAGGCAAPTVGRGGGGGGASVALFADQSSITLTGSTLQTAGGGRGGNGGAGIPGQPGGPGGPGGDAPGAGSGKPGGTGGTGGRGGASGGGGGGAGGLSVGLLHVSSTITQSGNTFPIGPSGPGGDGGNAAGTPAGSAGAGGVAAPVRACNSAVDC